jgi:hypothetical protein
MKICFHWEFEERRRYMNNLIKTVTKRVIAEIEDEVRDLMEYESENPYVERLVSDRITKQLIRLQEILSGNHNFL